MNIIIVGAGTVGFSLAKHFSSLKHHVTLIEQNQLICEQANSKLDVSAIANIGSAPAALEEAGIKIADMLIAVTPSDEINLLTCNFAMQNGVKKRIARVKSDLYTSNASCINLEQLGVTHVIEPEREVVKRILQYVELPGVLETASFQSDNIYLRGYQITEDMPIVNKTLAEIKQMAKTSPMLFVIIMRNGKSLPATGDQKLSSGDKIVAIMPADSFKAFRTLINRKSAKLTKVVVSGDSLTAIHLTEALRPLCERVILVDPNEEHGNMAASMLDGVEVLHGDCTDSEILQEIQVEHADYFIAANKDTEDNIMSCLLARSEGANRVIAIRDNERYNELFSSLGIDYIITVQQITINSIIEKVQTISLGAYIQLKTADIEVIRLKAEGKSLVVGKSLRDLEKVFKKSVIIGCIMRENSVLIPDGSTIIKDKDEAIVLCNKKYIQRVSKQFSR